MKVFRNIALILIVLIAISVISLCVAYNHYISPVDKNNTEMLEVIIPSGSTTQKIGEILEEKELIRSSTFFNIYVKLYDVSSLKASTYLLSKNMDLKEIISVIEKGNSYNPNQIKITFKEGINVRELANQISTNTSNTYEDVMSFINNQEYLNELTEKYWFITKNVTNKNLYYALEGYLFPDTYYFNNKDITVKEIFGKMLDRMDEVLSEYKKEIEESKYSVHEILTLASIIEKEGKTKDFKEISAVFHNRLNKKMELGSCATAYYGMGLDFNEIGIANSEMINNDNLYNTYKIQTLPIGPIALPSKNAIEAAINPKEDSKCLYFLSDNEGVTYFFETYTEHQKKEQQLKNEGKWYR